MKFNPLLSNELSGLDINDESKNENYTREIGVLFNELIEDLQKADPTGTGRVTEDELLDFLQSKLPQNKQLNINLFKQLLQDIDRNIDMNIDLNDFCKKYIQAHEELKLNFETLKKGFDKEKSLKNELESKIQEVKYENLNKNGISPNACVSTIIGKITFLSQINTDQVYLMVKLDENEDKRTSVKNIENPIFTEKFTFPIEDKQSTLSYKLYSASTNNQLKETLEDISLPYKSEFEKSELRLLKGGNLVVNDDQLVNGVEGVLKHAFKDKKVKWIFTLKFILYFCILCLLFTTLVKPDFISLFICLILLILLNTNKTNYFFEHFKVIIIGICIMIAYDLMDYLFLRKFEVELMSAVEGWGRFFGFLGFLGKIALLLAALVVKVKFEKTGVITE